MIECRDVSFSYPASNLSGGERQAVGALKHISCTIEEGSFVLLCGTSGCGKTTMTRLFNGLIPHYHAGTYTGAVYLDGKDTQSLSLFDISLKVGSVFQNPRSQFFNVDTTSEMAFGPENHGMPEAIVRSRVKRAAAQLKLEPLLDRSIFSLSGGEKQKIACGSAAAMEPDIYVLDEPSSNLDAYAIADFRQLLFTLKAQGKTIIISEHRLYYLAGLFDRVLYLKDGEIAGDYTAEEFCRLSPGQRDEMGLRPLELGGLSEVEGPPQRMSEALWRIEDVSFAYKRGPETLHITEAAFPAGGAAAVIGHNGAGKSTLARCLCGLEKHVKGRVRDQSRVYARKERLKLCYMVMQDVNHQLFTESVLDEILLSMETEDEQRAREILKEMDLLPYEACHPMGLSGGQKQRVAVASAIASERPLILFDEPTSGLDLFHMRQVADVVGKVAKAGRTALVVTHDPEFILRCCHYVLHLEHGQIQESYSLENENGRSRLLKFFLDDTKKAESTA
ncbi:MAG: energy-coupling factor ABC transporter ATP-binding protein [Eubacterium sp.]|nr:energy-coupling factor ABC transporter ATP-binding protein [Eubacterium sp.]